MKKYVLTSFQKQILSVCMKNPDDFSYNIPAAIKIKGKVDKNQLLNSIDCLFDIYPEMKIILFKEKNDFFQKIGEKKIISCKKSNEEEIEKCLIDEAKKPLSIFDHPLSRVTIWEINEKYYIVQITISHIIADRASLSILFESFWKTYQSNSTSAAKNFNINPSFFDYLENDHVNKNTQLNYWKSKLSNLDIKNYFPANYTDQAEIYNYGDKITDSIDEKNYYNIKQYCKENKVTPYVFFASILNALFFKASEENDIVIGTAVSTRPINFLNTFGPFVNTVLLRTIIESDTKTYGDLIKNINLSINEALKASDVSLGDIFLSSESLTSRNKNIFQCMYVFQGMDFESKEDKDIQMKLFLVDNESTKFDINIYIFDSGLDFKIKIEYAKNVFNNLTIKNFIAQLCETAINLSKNKINYFSDSIYQEHTSPLRKVESGEIVIHENNSTLLGAIFNNIKHLKQEIAIFDGDTSYTYALVGELTNNAAKNLKQFGICKNAIVGVYTYRSGKLLPIILALWRLGATYLPLEKATPMQRIQSIIDDAKPALIICQNKDDLSELKPIFNSLFTYEELFEKNSNINLSLSEDKSILYQSNAYLLFTSGSTGRPKGVLIDHQALYNRILWMKDFLAINSNDNVLQKTSLMFDVSIWELILSLFSGSKMTIASEQKNSDPDYIAKTIDKYQVTICHFVPVFLDVSLSTFKLFNFNSLKHVVCSGDVLKPLTIVNFYALFPKSKLYNFYGPTEASIDVSFFICSPDYSLRVTPIGKPIWNTILFLLDENGKVINDYFTSGELMIAGDGLSIGYCNNEFLTNQKFIITHLCGKAIRAYKTGDLAKWGFDNELIFLGRADRQVKIRGVRIETEEIENIISSYSGIKSSYVCKYVDDDDNVNLIAYLISEDKHFKKENLRIYLEKYLPAVMMPNQIICLDSFPFMPSGKVNTALLPKPKTKQITYSNTEDPLALLIKILKEVLSIKTIKPDDNFFSLGGDSIKSIQVISLARKFGYYFTVSDFLKTPTVLSLSKYHDMTKISGTATINPFSLLTEQDAELLKKSLNNVDAYPLSQLQKTLVYHSEVDESYSIYVTSFRIKAIFNFPLWENAIKSTCDAFPIMRTFFDLGTYSEPLQIVLKNHAVCLSLDYYDLRNITDAEYQFKEFFEKEKFLKFCWETAPLFRFNIHQLKDDEIQLTISEPCLDGWSVATISSVLLKYYLAYITKKDYKYVEPNGSLAALIQQERQVIKSEKYLTFWGKLLKNCYKTILNKSPDITASSFRLEHKLSCHQTNILKSLATNNKFPIKSLLLSIHCFCIGKLLNTDNLTTGIMANMRPEVEDSEKLASIFLNILPVTVNLANETFLTLAAKLTEIEAEINQYRQIPYGTFLSNNNSKIFDAIFNFTNFHPYKEFINNEYLSILEIQATDQTFFDITVQFSLLSVENRIRLAIDFNRISKNSEFPQKMLDNFESFIGEQLSILHKLDNINA